MLEYCRVERDGPLFIVTIDRPEVRNALHPLASRELEKVFDDFCADPIQIGLHKSLVDFLADDLFDLQRTDALEGPADFDRRNLTVQ